MKTVVFFNNKGGVGKTSLAYHLAWMLNRLGRRVLALDLDPQANLSSAFLDEDRLEELWPESGTRRTILGALEPLLEHLGDIVPPHVEVIADGLGLVPGDLGLSLFEDRLAEAWPKCLTEKAADAADAFRVTTSFYRIAAAAALELGAELVLIDVAPSLGALNRAALVAADYVVVPLGVDLFSLQGLRNLGPTLKTWRAGWARRVIHAPATLGAVPSGRMHPIGYVVMQHAVRGDRPVKAYQRWVERIPEAYVTELGEDEQVAVDPDPNRLAMLKHYRSLMPLAQDARKPMFALTPADGALGGHTKAVQDCYADFERLAREIVRRVETDAARHLARP